MGDDPGCLILFHNKFVKQCLSLGGLSLTLQAKRTTVGTGHIFLKLPSDGILEYILNSTVFGLNKLPEASVLPNNTG